MNVAPLANTRQNFECNFTSKLVPQPKGAAWVYHRTVLTDEPVCIQNCVRHLCAILSGSLHALDFHFQHHGGSPDDWDHGGQGPAKRLEL